MFWKKIPKEFEFLKRKYKGDELVALDTETTGLDPSKDEILSIAAVPIKGNEIMTSEALSLTLKPSGSLTKKSVTIHKLRLCDLQEGLDPKEAIEKLLHFIQNRPLLGYYLDFDVKILSRYTNELFGFKLPNPTIEVSGLYYDYKQKLIPQGYVDLRFDTILEDLDIPSFSHHNALSDAVMSALIYLKLQRRRHGKGSGF
ncbi:MAG: DNA polymerase III subunit epsilon [Epsilonproteobacteria bacterium]|nr:DNA polymerase III subunit epsilon [Campylobacterota bacterium]NPA65110.1 3'-5' exonuclease [Campylobacterota bacterium]